MKRTTTSALFAIVAALAAHAVTPVPWEVPPEVRTIQRAEILADSAAVTAEAFPDADTVLMDSVTYERYQPDGTSVVYDDTYSKILTEKGRREEATSSLHYNAFYGECEIVAAEIVKASGAVVPVDLERNARVMVDPGSMSMNIYDPNDKILRISYPDLEIGDIVRLAFRRTTRKARVPDVWSDYQTFESPSPIRRYSYYVSSPAERPIKRCVLRDEIPGTITNRTATLAGDPSRTLHVWDVRDVPQLFPEPDMPAAYTVCQRVLTSTAASWGELSAWYWNLCRPRLESVNDEMRATASNLVAKSDGGQASIVWNIFTWVSQNIRYMGVTTETEAPGYEPHDVSTTFDRRHGVCRDKAALLVSLLRLAGVDAYPVLIHAGEKRDPDVPMTFFNHAIVGVREADGSYTLMDPTNENAHDLLPAYLAGKSYLVATPEGEDLRVSDDVPASANMLFARSKGRVDDKGALSLETVLEFEGLNDSAYRGMLIRTPEERRRTFFEGLAKRLVPGATLTSLAIEPADLRDTDTPLSVKLSLTAPDFPARGKAATLIDPPWFSSAVGYVNFIVESTGLERRRFPLETENACGVEETVELELDSAGEAIALPETCSFRTNGVTFSQSASLAPPASDDAPARLRATRRFELNLTSYPPEIYRGLKDALHEVERLGSQRAILENGQTPSDAASDQLVISRDVSLDVVDETCWTTTVSVVREILTYAGRKAGSELKIPFNPAWQEVELLHASVSNANGQVLSVGTDEINVMDAPWVASAPRYPPGKTMVVSLPGVEIGSTVRTSYRIVQTKAPFLHGSHVFQSANMTLRDTFTLSSGENILINTHGYNADNLVETVVTNNGIETVTLTVHRPETLPREDSVPPAFAYATTLSYSSGNWSSYAERLGQIAREASSPANAKACAAKVREICREIEDPWDQMVAIRDFVARNIRLAGPAFTDIPLAATPADVTLRDGYGNLLDRAVVLSAMLSEAGIDNNFAFADDQRPLDSGDYPPSPRYLFPSPSVFTVPLVTVQFDDDAHPVFLNDTDQYALPGMTGCAGHYALCPVDVGCAPADDVLLDDEEQDTAPIFTVDVADEFAPRSVDMRHVELDADGNAYVTVTNFYFGKDAAVFRKRYAEMTPEHLRRHHQELVGTLSVAATVAGDLCVETNSLPFFRAFRAYVPDLASRAGDTLTLDLGLDSAILPLRADTRKLPLLFPARDESASFLTVTLPPEAEAVLMDPKQIKWDLSDAGVAAYRRASLMERRDDGRLEFNVITIREGGEATVLPPELYKSILEMNRVLSRPEEGTLVIRLAK